MNPLRILLTVDGSMMAFSWASIDVLVSMFCVMAMVPLNMRVQSFEYPMLTSGVEKMCKRSALPRCHYTTRAKLKLYSVKLLRSLVPKFELARSREHVPSILSRLILFSLVRRLAAPGVITMVHGGRDARTNPTVRFVKIGLLKSCVGLPRAKQDWMLLTYDYQEPVWK